MLLVVLRLCLGCHFLYEGVWKIKRADEFSAEPFLTQAKGPVSGLFYAMVPDINGRERLRVSVAVEKDDKGVEKKKIEVDIEPLQRRWEQYREEFLAFYRPGRGADEDAQKAFAELEKRSETVMLQHREKAKEYLTENAEDIDAYFKSLDRSQEDKEAGQGAPFQKKRRWDRMLKYRAEAAWWIAEIEAREDLYKQALRDGLTEEQKDKGPVPSSWNPLRWTRMQQINFAVTYGLTAIGACLLLGLCTRLAALGGGGFMLFVVMTQPAWPAIYPPDPAVVGHALLINKDFVEMVALFLVATTAVGRWGGLDYFLHHLFVEPFLSKRIVKKPA